MSFREKFAFLLFAATFATTAYASKLILPDSCGADDVKFDIDTKKYQPPPAPPAAGMAQIVFIETLEKSGVIGTPTVRFGMDGAWVGADKGNAYFVLSVAPGVHHLCSNWAKSVGLISITVEAGKVYYYQHKISLTYTSGPMVPGAAAPGQPPPMVATAGRSSNNAVYGMLDEEEGRYRIKASALSVSTAKK